MVKMMGCTQMYKFLLGIIIILIEMKQIISGTINLRVKRENAADGKKSLIVGGTQASVFQWPWQAALTTCKDNKCELICGAVLIAPEFILTAAHCVTLPKSVDPISLDTIKIYLGPHHRDENKDTSSVQNMTAKYCHIHSNYSATSFDGDIALIKLSSPASLDKSVATVNLPPLNGSNNLVQANKGYISGWGITSDGNPSDTLQYALLPVVSNDICEKSYHDRNLMFKITENMFCAGFEKGLVDSCEGDSGGPMVFKNENNWILEGIVSWGSPFGCGFPRQYGVYTRVDRFVSWIKSIMEEY